MSASETADETDTHCTGCSALSAARCVDSAKGEAVNYRRILVCIADKARFMSVNCGFVLSENAVVTVYSNAPCYTLPNTPVVSNYPKPYC